MSQLAWMISLLPESIFVFLMYTLLLCGGLLYAASKLVNWIPLMSQYHLPAELAAVALLIVSVYFFGWRGNEAQERLATPTAVIVNARYISYVVAEAMSATDVVFTV